MTIFSINKLVNLQYKLTFEIYANKSHACSIYSETHQIRLQVVNIALYCRMLKYAITKLWKCTFSADEKK